MHAELLSELSAANNSDAGLMHTLPLPGENVALDGTQLPEIRPQAHPLAETELASPEATIPAPRDPLTQQEEQLTDSPAPGSKAEILFQQRLAEEKKLLAIARGGCPDADAAFARALDLHRPLLLAELQHGRSPEDAEDIVQEAFMRALRYRQNFTDKGKGVAPWLYTIARRAAIDASRRQGREIETVALPDLSSTPEIESVEPTVLAGHGVALALGKLNDPSARDLIWYIDIMGMSNTEYANLRGANVGTVGSQLSRARTTLRTIVQKLQAKGEF